MDTRFLLKSTANGPRLRVGLLMNGFTASRWVSEVIGQMIASNFVTIALVVLNESAEAGARHLVPKRSFARRVVDLLGDSKRRRNVLFGLYQRWDDRNGDPAIDPLVPVDCSELLSGVRTMWVKPIRTRYVNRFADEDLKEIVHEKLDVIVRFGFDILRGDVLRAARYGCWSYHHGDNEFYRGGPPCFWELVEANPCSGAVLQVLTEGLDDGKILCKGVYATELGLSQARNRLRPYWGASTFLIQKLRELHQYGWDYVEKRVVPTRPYKGRKEIYRAPTNWEIARWLVRRVTRALFRRLNSRPMVLHWQLGIRLTAIPLLERCGDAELTSFRWITSPPDHYYADPFVVDDNHRRWVFFEDYDCQVQSGTIRCAEILGTKLVDGGEVLKRPYHLSYPCVFRDSGTWYMIPESLEKGRLELYTTNEFPGGWKFVRDLMEVEAVDSTIWIESGVYWLFVSRVEPRGKSAQLWLYSSQSLASEWVPHPDNPLTSDVRHARGAGAIFRYKGRLFRPSQDGTIRYGRRILFNEILELSTEAYRERAVGEIEPKLKGELLGIHTYARSGELEVIDGQVLIDI